MTMAIFSIQIGAYLEEDDDLNQPTFKFRDQGSSQSGAIQEIHFSAKKIILTFRDSDLFLEKYKTVELLLDQPVNRKMVDFFANHLFLASFISWRNNSL